MRWLYTTFYSEDKYTKSIQASEPQGQEYRIPTFSFRTKNCNLYSSAFTSESCKGSLRS